MVVAGDRQDEAAARRGAGGRRPEELRGIAKTGDAKLNCKASIHESFLRIFAQPETCQVSAQVSGTVRILEKGIKSAFFFAFFVSGGG